MFALNGIPLDNTSRGWKQLSGSVWHAPASIQRPDLIIPGYDGQVALQGRSEAPRVTFRIGCFHSAVPQLMALLRQQTLTLTRLTDSTTTKVQLISATPEATPGSRKDDPWTEVDIVLLVPNVWMFASETTETVALDVATKTVNVLAGITGSVDDALLRVTDVTDIRITDGATGHFVRYTGTVEAGSYLRIDAKTGRAWLTTSDTWSGGTEQTLASGKGPYFLRIQPVMTASSTTGRLTAFTAARGAGAAIEVRARNAYQL